MSTSLATPEFSRTVSIDELSSGGLQRHLSASRQEMAALSRRFGLADMTSLEADIDLRVAEQGRIRVKVTFTADVLQSCVVTLEPVPARLNEGFEVVFAPEPGDDGSDHGEVVIDAMADDPPEPLTGDEIDIGELVAQHLALAIEPYPRKQGANWTPDDKADPTGAGGDRENPFAVLAELKKQQV